MKKRKKITYREIADAFYNVNYDTGDEVHSVISKSKGEIYYQSDVAEVNQIPKEAEENNDYVWVQGREDLGLGKQLIYEFTREYLPGEYPVVRNFFEQNKAYTKFKGHLSKHNLLKKWYEYIETKTKTALLKWCAENGIELDGDAE